MTDQWRWDWFVTLTFDVKRLPQGTRTVVGWKASADAWNDWLDGLTAQPGVWDSPGHGTGLPVDPYWVRGREPNPWRQGTHFHALIGGLPPTASRRDAWRDWFESRGLARILPFDPSKGAAHYLTKYVVKELGDVTFSSNLGFHRRVH